MVSMQSLQTKELRSRRCCCKFPDTISRLHGVAGESNDAVAAYTHVHMKEAPRLLSAVGDGITRLDCCGNEQRTRWFPSVLNKPRSVKMAAAKVLDTISMSRTGR